MILLTELLNFLTKTFGSYKLSADEINVSVVCPKCKQDKGESYSKKKLVIRTDDLRFHCFVCGTKGKKLGWLIKKYKPIWLEEYNKTFSEEEGDFSSCLLKEELTIEEEERLAEEAAKKVELPKDFVLLASFFDKENIEYYIKDAKNYLLSRGMTKRDFWYFQFGITREQEGFVDRVIIPSYDQNGKLNYFTARGIYKRCFPKYLNPTLRKREDIIFNEINIDWSEELTLVEGPFDLTKCNENSTCLLGKALNENYLLFKKIIENDTPILLCLDDDAKKEQLTIALLLCQYGVSVRMVRIPDKIHDVGEMNKEQFLELRETAIKFDMENYLKYKLDLVV